MLRSAFVVVLMAAVGVGATGVSVAATPPTQVRLVTTPPAHTQKTTATFVVGAPKGTRLRCRLDLARPWRCGTRITLRGLKPGKHRLSVRGVRRGRALRTAVHTWHVVVPMGTPVVGPPPIPDDAGAPASLTVPTVAGKATVGKTVAVVPGAWTGATKVEWRWQRCSAAGTDCVDVPHMTAISYFVTTADVGHALRVVERATNGAGTREAPSATTAVVPVPPANTAAPTISGSPKVGATLTSDTGTWTGQDVTLSLQWMRCAYNVGAGCTDIPGATGITYVLTAEDVTQWVILLVRASSPTGQTAAASDGIGPVQP